MRQSQSYWILSDSVPKLLQGTRTHISKLQELQDRLASIVEDDTINAELSVLIPALQVSIAQTLNGLMDIVATTESIRKEIRQ